MKKTNPNISSEGHRIQNIVLVSFYLSEWHNSLGLCIYTAIFYEAVAKKTPEQPTYCLLVGLRSVGCRKYGNSGNWKAINQLLQFFHAIKMFSLETEGFSRGEKSEIRGGGRISLTVHCPHRNGMGCRHRRPNYIVLLLHNGTTVGLGRTWSRVRLGLVTLMGGDSGDTRREKAVYVFWIPGAF